MIDEEKEEEKKEIQIYEIIRDEEDIIVAEAVVDYTPRGYSSVDNPNHEETKFDKYGFYKRMKK